LKDAGKATDALIYANMLNIHPRYTYEYHDGIADVLREKLGEYVSAGWRGITKDSIIGEWYHGQIPKPFESDDELARWTEEFGQMVGDLPFYLIGMAGGAFVGGLVGTPEFPVVGTISGGVVGAGAGGFGLTRAMRQWLVDKYDGKQISAFREILDVFEAAGKGALTGAAFGVAGEVAPVATGAVGRYISPRLYKAAAELATMTTVGSLLEGRVPTKRDFIDNAAMFAAIHVGTLGYGGARDYLQNTYARAGVHPAEVLANPDSVAPPMEEGDEPLGNLKPAIRIGERVEAGEPGETHPDILQRMYPEGEAPAEAERGFAAPQRDFLTREEARSWVEENEPEVYKAWQGIAGEGAEFHSEDYNEAARQVHGKEAGPSLAPLTAELKDLRTRLKRIERGLPEGSRFGEALRTFFVGNRDARIAETNQLADSLHKLVPDYRDQEALSLVRDFKNRPGELAERRARYEAGDVAKLKKLIPIIDRALNPTAQILEADRRLTEYFQTRLEEGKRLGFLDSQITNEEYITHLLRPETEPEEPAATFLPRPAIGRYLRFAKERKYPTVLDALETGKVRAQTLNALDALTIYGSKHATAAATRMFVNELKETELGKWGFKNADNIPDGWVELAPGIGLFRNIIPYIDKETGEPRKALQMLMVPTKVRDAMRPILEGATLFSVPGFSTFRAAQMYIKAAELGLSVFHMKALNISALSNEGLRGLMRSWMSDMESTEFKDEEVDGIRNGLQTPVLGRTVEAYRAVQPKTFPSRTDVLRELPGVKQVEAVAAWLTHETFDVMQRKFKVMDYATKKAAWMAKHPDAASDELIAAKRGIAREVNAVYGGLNWEVMGASRNFRAVAQAILLAPDWTFSNFLNLKYAFEGGPAGTAARAFWIRSALIGMGMTQAMSLAVSGQPSNHPTEVYIGKDKHGREVYSNMFFAGAPKDLITFMNNVSEYGAVIGTAVTIGNKLSPVVRTAIQLETNRDWMGRQIVKRGTGVLKGTAEGAWHIVLDTAPIPFSITNAVRMLTDTTHDYGFWDYLTMIGGAPPRHVLPKGVKPLRTGKKKFSIRGSYR
jgi:hypothetical protein